MRYHFEIIQESKGYSALGIEIEGLITQAETWQALVSNIQEIYHLWFDDVSGYTEIPKPLETSPQSKNIISFPVPEKLIQNLESFWRNQGID